MSLALDLQEFQRWLETDRRRDFFLAGPSAAVGCPLWYWLTERGYSSVRVGLVDVVYDAGQDRLTAPLPDWAQAYVKALNGMASTIDRIDAIQLAADIAAQRGEP